MKKIFGLLIVFTCFWASAAFAQTEEDADKTPANVSQVTEETVKPGKVKRKSEESNVYSPNEAKPASPYAAKNNDIGGFTVTKFKESKTAKKLRRGEAHSRMSVPDPKGKPLKHKKKSKFKLFN